MLYLAELYLPRGASPADAARRARAGAAAPADAGHGVRFVQAIFVPLDESCFVLYQAESAADVTAAGTRAGLTFDRVAEAIATWLGRQLSDHRPPPWRPMYVDFRVHAAFPLS